MTLELASADHGNTTVNLSGSLSPVPAFSSFLSDPDPTHCEKCWGKGASQGGRACTTACKAHLVHDAIDAAPGVGVCSGVTIRGNEVLITFDGEYDADALEVALAAVALP